MRCQNEKHKETIYQYFQSHLLFYSFLFNHVGFFNGLFYVTQAYWFL